MQIGMIGLGRMGANMVRRLRAAGHDCVVWDHNPQAVAALVKEGANGAATLAELVKKLAPPRHVWLMIPAAFVDATLDTLAPLLSADDAVIDGGNSYYRDDIARARRLAERKLHYVDCGTSGGVWGLERGYCLMIGGDKEAVQRLDPIFSALSPGEGTIPRTPRRETRDPRVERGYLHCGPSGAGHFVKMVHNGIEYGLMQAYAEGFEILRKVSSEAVPAERRYDLDLADIAEVWRRGSVVSSWLLDLTSSALAEDPALSKYSGFVEDSGEGRWTINAAIEEAVPADVLSAALYARFRSRDREGTANKLLSAMRHAFGGHVEPKK